MKAQSIQAIQDLPAKGLVYAFEGQITKIFKRSEGENAHGKWSIESVMAKDASGAEIKLMLKDREPCPYGVGTSIRVEAYKGDKGYSGLYAEDDDYKGKVTRILRVTPTADLSRVDEAPSQRQAPASQPNDGGWDEHEPAPRQAPREPAREAPRHDESGKAVTPKEVKLTVLQIANLYLESLLATRYVAEAYKEKTGMDMSEGQRQACASSIFIKADRLNLHTEMPKAKI
jgi:hypothetical protein